MEAPRHAAARAGAPPWGEPPQPLHQRYPFGALAVGCAGILYLAYLFREAVIPFALSFALAYVVNPFVKILEARGLRREQVVVMLYVVIAAGVMVIATLLIPTIGSELSQMQTKAPDYFSKSKEFLSVLQARFASQLPVGQQFAQQLSLKMYAPLMDHLQKLPGYLLGLFPLLSLLFLVPFITFFMLMESSKALQAAVQLCPSRYVEQVLHLLSDVDTALGNYVRGVLLECLAIAVMTFGGLSLLGLDYALAIGTLSGIANVIPYGGAVIGVVAAGAVAVFQFQDAWMLVKVILMVLGVRAADDVFIQPIIARHSVDLHPLVYLLVLLIGGHAFGFAGLLLGVPAACVIKSLFRVAWDWYSTERRFVPRPSPAGLAVPYT